MKKKRTKKKGKEKKRKIRTVLTSQPGHLKTGKHDHETGRLL